MKKPPLGRLEEVKLRTYWEREDTEFTPWLAAEENIALLGETIEMELEVLQQEANVGPFRADILCRNTQDQSLVLIENQLERTDHTHLGQLLTYAAGLDAVTLVWVVQRFTEEHRAALDWLNRITEGRIHFFGIEVQVWRIGESAAAPKFHLVAKPNDWSKAVRERATGAAASPAETLRFDYWSALKEHLEAKGSPLRTTTPPTSHWWNFSLGKTGIYLSAIVSARDKFLEAKLYLEGPDAHHYFDLLAAQRAAIDHELGGSASWDKKEDRLACQIILTREADPSDRTTWPELHQWMQAKLELLDVVFRRRVATLRRPEATGEDVDQ